MADLLDLGRTGQRSELSRQASQLRDRGDWTAHRALELACAWLLAGDARQADLACLEADQLAPGLGLVPDVWGLWPDPAATADAPGAEESRQILEQAEQFRRWRHADAQALWEQLRPRLAADWRQALDTAVGDPLLILAHISAGTPALDPPLEPELARLVADAEIAAEPAASNRYWQLVARMRPGWDLARIRAADLALARGDLETSGRWLADPSPEALANPWFHDVVARRALALGSLVEALDAWDAAIRTATSQEGNAQLEEIFAQRRREARRGPGVLQVRNLANRGEQAEAVALLERLLAEDPQWQPLRSLKSQIQSPPADVNAAGSQTTEVARPGASADAASGSGPTSAERAGLQQEVAAFSRLLDHAAGRLRSLGHRIDASHADLETTSEVPPDEEAAEADLQNLSRRLSDFEARFALA